MGAPRINVGRTPGPGPALGREPTSGASLPRPGSRGEAALYQTTDAALLQFEGAEGVASW